VIPLKLRLCRVERDARRTRSAVWLQVTEWPCGQMVVRAMCPSGRKAAGSSVRAAGLFQCISWSKRRGSGMGGRRLAFGRIVEACPSGEGVIIDLGSGARSTGGASGIVVLACPPPWATCLRVVEVSDMSA